MENGQSQLAGRAVLEKIDWCVGDILDIRADPKTWLMLCRNAGDPAMAAPYMDIRPNDRPGFVATCKVLTVWEHQKITLRVVSVQTEAGL